MIMYCVGGSWKIGFWGCCARWATFDVGVVVELKGVWESLGFQPTYAEEL